MTVPLQVCLDNGLKVIIKEVHVAPVTSTWLWYRVGSRNEAEGHTGLSHWVEHMLFKGSSQFPKGTIMRAVNRLGGYLNAMTSHDFTAYYETLPSQAAELALQIEADRMVTATFDPAEVEAERTVIIAEREGAENEPRYVLNERVAATAFQVHPYRHQTIGWKEDLRRLTREELLAHYRRYYRPNNAVLVVVGDVDAQTHLRAIERYFGTIPPGELPTDAIPAEPPQLGERRVTVRLPGATPIVRICYHTPPVAHPDYIPMVVLNAVLSGGEAMFAFGDSQAQSARLYRALVETQLASSVGSSYHPSLDPYLFSLGATVRQGGDWRAVEEALLAEVDKLQREPIQERELAVAIRQTQAEFAYSSESVTNQALTLGFLEMVDRHERMETVLSELAQVTPDDVLRVARTYLTAENRTVGWFFPSEQGGCGMELETETAEAAPRCRLCASASPRAGYTISPETVLRQRLANGVTVLIQENPASPSVVLEGEFLVGSAVEPGEKAGLANLTASMLRRGTEEHTFQELNEILEHVGASLGFSAGPDELGFSGQALAEDVDLLLDTLAEMLLRPTFPPHELDKLRGQLLTRLSIWENDTGYRAERAFMQALYPPDHPYARPSEGTRETLRALTPQDVADYYHTYLRPESLIVSLVGAVDAQRVLDKLATTLGHWQVPGEAPRCSVPAVETPAQIITSRVQLPDKPQADLIWGVVGMPRNSPDYYAAMMGNLILGHLGLMGRLGENVRDRQGLAYYVSSSLSAGRGPHPWTVMAGVNPKDIPATVAAILEEIARLRDEPVSDAELEDSRTYLTGALPLHLETNEGIATFLLNVEEYGLGLDYLQRYPDIIQRITKEEIQRVARRYLSLEGYVLALAGTLEQA